MIMYKGQFIYILPVFTVLFSNTHQVTIPAHDAGGDVKNNTIDNLMSVQNMASANKSLEVADKRKTQDTRTKPLENKTPPSMMNGNRTSNVYQNKTDNVNFSSNETDNVNFSRNETDNVNFSSNETDNVNFSRNEKDNVNFSRNETDNVNLSRNETYNVNFPGNETNNLNDPGNVTGNVTGNDNFPRIVIETENTGENEVENEISKANNKDGANRGAAVENEKKPVHQTSQKNTSENENPSEKTPDKETEDLLMNKTDSKSLEEMKTNYKMHQDKTQDEGDLFFHHIKQVYMLTCCYETFCYIKKGLGGQIRGVSH